MCTMPGPASGWRALKPQPTIEYVGDDTLWETTPAEDEYGTLWDASEWDQVSPMLTDEQGKYAWDVPEGWWRVKYEPEGYETVR